MLLELMITLYHNAIDKSRSVLLIHEDCKVAKRVVEVFSDTGSGNCRSYPSRFGGKLQAVGFGFCQIGGFSQTHPFAFYTLPNQTAMKPLSRLICTQSPVLLHASADPQGVSY